MKAAQQRRMIPGGNASMRCFSISEQEWHLGRSGDVLVASAPVYVILDKRFRAVCATECLCVDPMTDWAYFFPWGLRSLLSVCSVLHLPINQEI